MNEKPQQNALTTPSTNLPDTFSKNEHVERVGNRLEVIGLTQVTRKVLTPKQAEILQADLMMDLEPLFEQGHGDLIEAAIRTHKRESPFYPALSDIMKHIQPVLDAESDRRHREWLRTKDLFPPEPPPREKTPEELERARVKHEAFMAEQKRLRAERKAQQEAQDKRIAELTEELGCGTAAWLTYMEEAENAE